MKKIVFLALALAVFTGARAQEPHQKPVVVYLQNLPGERIGTDSDEEIIRDLKADGFYVHQLDCSGFPRTSPELEEALVAFHVKSKAYLNGIFPGDSIDHYSVLYVPAGYRVAWNIPVWNLLEHGPSNIIDAIFDSYNKDIAEKYKVRPVARPEDMVDRYGRPIDFDFCIDFIYPSGKPRKKVPLLLNFASNTPRFAPFSTSARLMAERAIFPIGFVTSGYAFANLDHCMNPLVRKSVYGYISRYTYDNFCLVAYISAALRFIHSQKDTYNLSGEIGTMGISKASFSSVVAANPDKEKMKERSQLYGPVNPDQPHQGYPSTVTVAYAAAGQGTNLIPDLVNENYVPMVTSMGKLDPYKSHWPYYAVVQSHLNRIDHNHLAFWMEDMGHTYPVKGVDYPTGISRYVLFKRFFDYHLKPEKEVEVLYILPKEGTNSVRTDGTFRWLMGDDILPSDMKQVSVMAPVTVRFLPEMDAKKIVNYLQVVNLKTGRKVAGTWKSSRQHTMFEFTPSVALEAGESYAVRVMKGAPDASGKQLEKTVEREFQVVR